jgi:sulfofructose kinase
MTPRRPRAIALGALCVTRIFQVPHIALPPAKVLAQRLVQVVDGMAVSAACAFARLGGEAALWARCGDDEAGHAARQTLHAEGLNVDQLRALPGAATSQAAVLVDARGERLVVPFHDPQVDASPQWLPLQDLHQADMVLCDVRWPEGAAAVMRAARAAGVPCMLDAEMAPLPVLQALVPLATHVVFSDAGLLAYTGGTDVDAALLQVAQACADSAVHVGASCGAEGYAWVERIDPLQWIVSRVPALQVAVVDTLAAGDIFHGALALALCEGKPMARAAAWACAAASLKCTRFGGRLGCPSRAELDAAVAASTPATTSAISLATDALG